MTKASQSAAPALLIVDMISEFQFPDWKPLLAAAARIAPRIASLASRARASRVPVIYVNDMPQDWQADRHALLERCCAPDARGRRVAMRLAPRQGDHFLFKPRHSGFYGTALAELLYCLKATELVITGTTSHQCVLFTAMDAYVRNYSLVAPRDCIGAPTTAQTRHALFILQDALRAKLPLSAAVHFGKPARRANSHA